MHRYWYEKIDVDHPWDSKLRNCLLKRLVKKLNLFFRETMMEGMADRHVLSRNYTKWKVKYETEQKNGLASLHFK